MTAIREYVDVHGKPVAFYSDKHAVFRVNGTDARRSGTTQFNRALRDLNIELICDNSSQAKGRVERANKTLQDRLVNEMRLHNISSISEANRWVAAFIDDFNRRFARPPKYPKDLHRPADLAPQELDDIFAWQDLGKLSKAPTFQYDKILYLVEPSKENSRIAGEKTLAFDYPDGTLAFRHGGRTLEYQMFDKLECISQGRIVDNKRLGAVLKLAQEKQDELEVAGKRGRSKTICPGGGRRFRSNSGQLIRFWLSHHFSNPVSKNELTALFSSSEKSRK